MAISRRVQDLLGKSDFDTLEGDWLTRLQEDPHDLDYFVGLARALVGHGEDGRARLLLEMLDEQLRQTGSWRQRLDLLRRAGEILISGAEGLHAEILATLEGLWGDRSSFAGLVEAVGLRRAPHDLPKTWEKVERLEELVAFDLGEVVWMEGKGAGRVAEVNLSLQSFRVEIAGQPRLAVGFRAAPKLLRPLPAGHLLRRKLEEPEALRALAESDPPALLRAVLETYDQPLTAGEIRRDLEGIVEEARWTTWWAAARKHPQVVTSTAGRQAYAWASSGAHALASVWEAFEREDPRGKLDVLRRDAGRDPDLTRRMEEALEHLAEEAHERDPGLALEIGFALERRGRAPAEAPWSPAALLSQGDPRTALAGLSERGLRERAYSLLAEQRPDWPGLWLAGLAREDDPRTLELLAGGLARAAAAELERFLDATLGQPGKAPAAFTWLAERAARDEALLAKSPLRLLQQVLAAPAAPEFAPFRGRLLALCESGGTVPRLFALLDPSQAAAAADAVHRAARLEPYRREALMHALQLRFPALRPQAPGTLHALPASLAAKRAELEGILQGEIPANRKAIEEARAHGDLRENFEYKAARQRHEYLTARAAELQAQLQRARPLDLAAVDPSEIRVGTTVELTDGTGSRRTLSLLGPWESDPQAGVLSYESEQGQLLLGKRPGDPVQLDGRPFTVTAIGRYPG